METNRLKQFCAVYEAGGLRVGAQLLNMSHGALSKSIKVLESELGYGLFLNQGRGIVPTDEAKTLYPIAKKLLFDFSKVYEPNIVDIKKTLKIATFEIFSTYSVQELFPSIPDYNVSLHETRQGELEQAILGNTVDFGITYEPIPTQNVDFLKIGTVDMGIYGTGRSYEGETLTKIPFVAPIRPVVGAPSGVKGLDGWPDHLEERHIKYRVDMLESALSIARCGLAVVFIPDFIAVLHNKTVRPQFHLKKNKTFKKVKKISRNVYLVKRTGSREDEIMKKIAKWLRLIIKLK